MVEQRCSSTLLAKTEGVAGPVLARNEVNPRVKLAQACWSLPGKDHFQTIETIYRPVSFNTSSFYVSSFGMRLNGKFNKQLFNQFMVRENFTNLVIFRIRFYNPELGQFLTGDKFLFNPSNKYIYDKSIQNTFELEILLRALFGRREKLSNINLEFALKNTIQTTYGKNTLDNPIMFADASGHFLTSLFGKCAIGALKSGGICLAGVFASKFYKGWDESKVNWSCAGMFCGGSAIHGCIAGMLSFLPDFGFSGVETNIPGSIFKGSNLFVTNPIAATCYVK